MTYAMETKQYDGHILRLEYPAFLTLDKEEPEWYAVGPNARTTVLLSVDPEPALAEGFAHMIRNPFFTRSGGAKIDREGHFRTAKGIEGYERVTRLVNPLGVVETRGWLVEGRFRGGHLLNIQITTVEQDWYDGTIWKAFLSSIEVIGASRACAEATHQPTVVQGRPSAMGRQERPGKLTELSPSLDYLLDLASEISSLPSENLDDNPEFPNVVERHLRHAMHGLSKVQARSKVKADREQLWEWLKRYPPDRYPETRGLHVVIGALLYADEIFK